VFTKPREKQRNCQNIQTKFHKTLSSESKKSYKHDSAKHIVQKNNRNRVNSKAPAPTGNGATINLLNSVSGVEYISDRIYAHIAA
jgi:outer membrane lipoprotein-sorting protein